MVLTDKEIRIHSNHKENPMISPFQEDQLQSASYDVKLSGRFSTFKKNVQTIDLSKQMPKDASELYEVDIMGEDGYILQPKEFILVELQETITLPEDLVAHIRPRTRFTRIGLLVASQHCNPTYSGRLYLGVFNAGPNALKLSKGISIAQLVFERLSDIPSEEKWYKNAPKAAYKNESGFRGSILNEQGWTEELEEIYKEILSSLNK